MLFGETTIVIDSAALVGGLSAAASIIGGAIVAAGKIVSAAAGRVDSTMQRLHEENRVDRDAMLAIMNQQWGQLAGVAKATREIKHKVGAGPEA